MEQQTGTCTDEKVLGVFAKFWEPGRVKTRLAREIGDQVASEIYRLFLEIIVKDFAQIPCQRLLAFSPPDRQEEFEGLAGSHWELTSQIPLQPSPTLDLGERMDRFFAERFSQGARRVVLLGSDSPTLPISMIETAFVQLRQKQVVLGPAVDGGYYLIGMNEYLPQVFANVRWSSPQVLDETKRNLQAARIDYALLSEYHDIDDWQGALLLAEELRNRAIDQSDANSPQQRLLELLDRVRSDSLKPH
jgi:rSAM/selenodomain-associated transferase 1